MTPSSERHGTWSASGIRAAHLKIVTGKSNCRTTDGLSGILYKGRWFYQKFHHAGAALSLGQTYLDPSTTYLNHSATQFTLKVAHKTHELPVADVEAALRFEFDLPWPNEQRVGRADEAVAAWRAAVAREAR